MQAVTADVCLVYLENIQPFADVIGVTHFGRILRSSVDNGISWVEVQLLTDDDGTLLYQTETRTVLATTIVSNKPLREIQPHYFYQISSSNDSLLYDQPKATGFVIKSNTTQPLVSTSRSGFGSGVYGIYIANPKDLGLFLTEPDQKTYQIDCKNPYIIQDRS